MIRLGITGGIGGGKSYVSRMLHDDFGLPVYNCDIRARIIMLSDPEVRDRLSELIPGVYDPMGEIDKRRMADYLFASQENAQRVNGIVHPAVRRDLRLWYDLHSADDIVGMESAILFESKFDDEVDKVLYVDAPLELRIQRTMTRDGLCREQVERRIVMQKTTDALLNADFVINNDGQANLHAQLQKIINDLLIK